MAELKAVVAHKILLAPEHQDYLDHDNSDPLYALLPDSKIANQPAVCLVNQVILDSAINRHTILEQEAKQCQSASDCLEVAAITTVQAERADTASTAVQACFLVPDTVADLAITEVPVVALMLLSLPPERNLEVNHY